ncbi:TPA: class I SAM-dependent methyltransferase [Candidatus Micrarchaeota archaeon]|nr:class I SAM-dependent methyltransferase [Candidatus Micrarchaeota archaeon]
MNPQNYDAKKEWTNTFIAQSEMAYPAEYVIRIFKGSYPRLNFDKSSYKGKKILDISCGDGCNMPLLARCGFEVYGTEITQEIANKTMSNLAAVGVRSDIRIGTNDHLPFENGFFDFLLSWNACYYMGALRDFSKHVAEYARVLKPEGYLVMSIPKKTSFIFNGSDPAPEPGYRIIRNDPYKIRNGESLRVFEDEKEIENAFSSHFKDFVHADVHDDCFGREYHWHLTIGKRK